MPPKRKTANGNKFAEPLPQGTILEDIGKKKWRLGPSIGKGGFGEIYSAQEQNFKGGVYPYVIKIEPHTNGPLFVEINFYIRHAKAADIEEFKKSKGLKMFGMPVYYGSGSLQYKDEKYRFLVMDKFSTDLYKLYIDNNKVFPTDTVFKVGLQILDILEYIHQRGYVHADIKAANILLGAAKETQNKQVYLVDFGLVTKYTMEKEFKPNPKKAHDGTIEFLSKDAHQGVQTRRGDLEILAYNLIQWLGCKLPWEGNLRDPKVVQNSKEEHMATVPKMIKASFSSRTPPKAIVDYLKYIKTLKFNTEPDYKKIRDIFILGVKEGGGSVGTPLQFSGSRTPLKRNRTPRPNNSNEKTTANKNKDCEVDDESETPKPKKRGRPRNDLVIPNDEDDIAVTSSDEVPNNSFITVRKPKNKSTSNKIKNVTRNKSKSFQDLSNELNFERYTMEEIKPKKLRTAVQLKRNRGHPQTNKGDIMKSSNNEENGEISSDEEEMPKPGKRGKRKQNLAYVLNEESDAEMASADNSNNEIADSVTSSRKEKKNGITKGKKGLSKRVSRSLTDLRNATDFEGYTDAMKEIILKRQKAGGRKNRIKLTEKPTSQNDDMEGFTEEMIAIALKKKSKEKADPAIPIATTSKASDKRGLVKPNSKRLQRKATRTRGKVSRYSDGSVSD